MIGRSGVRTSIQSMRCRPERCPGVYTPVLSTGWPTAEAGVYVAKARVVMQVPTSLRWLLPDVLRLGRRLRLLLELAGRSQSLPSLMRQPHVKLGPGYRVPVTVRACNAGALARAVAPARRPALRRTSVPPVWARWSR